MSVSEVELVQDSTVGYANVAADARASDPPQTVLVCNNND
jgi:hypothetical protein